MGHAEGYALWVVMQRQHVCEVVAVLPARETATSCVLMAQAELECRFAALDG